MVEYSTEFLEFWKAYPKKKAKGAAWQEWKKARPPLPEVLESLEWQKESDKWKEGFILDPERYIKKRCWEDEPDEEQDDGDSRGANPQYMQNKMSFLEQEIARVTRASNGH